MTADDLRLRLGLWLASVRRGTRAVQAGLTPPRLFAGSFLLLIVLATLALRWLPGLYVGEPLGWVDCLFTATSAVCVTGLIVVDTATYFTPFGQGVLLAMIQIGGLGFLTLTTTVILALGGRLSLHHRTAAAAPAEVALAVDYRRLTIDIVRFALLFELIGALCLYLLWIPRFGATGAVWPAVFHSISAFCNAGFSSFSDSLVGFADAPWTLAVVMTLIVGGGLGFLTLEEAALAWRARRLRRAQTRERERAAAGGANGAASEGTAESAEDERAPIVRVSLHSRLVLVTTAVLLVVGWLGFALFEWNVTLRDETVAGRLVGSLFLGVTARTAGFNTVDYSEMATASIFLTIILMTIGGAPGSTAGGLKVTTLALIALLAWNRLRGGAVVSVWRRSVPQETIQRAVGLFVLASAILTLSIFGYTIVEIGIAPRGATPGAFLSHTFEAVSAFNTVGLSMGVTGDLSTGGRLLTIVLMYLGRVGPLAFAAAIVLRDRTPERSFRWASEDVAIG